MTMRRFLPKWVKSWNPITICLGLWYCFDPYLKWLLDHGIYWKFELSILSGIFLAHTDIYWIVWMITDWWLTCLSIPVELYMGKYCCHSQIWYVMFCGIVRSMFTTFIVDIYVNSCFIWLLRSTCFVLLFWMIYNLTIIENIQIPCCFAISYLWIVAEEEYCNIFILLLSHTLYTAYTKWWSSGQGWIWIWKLLTPSSPFAIFTVS